MTPRERGIAALELREPTDCVPFFELGFQLEEEAFGTGFPTRAQLAAAGPGERERLMGRVVEMLIAIGERYDHSVLRLTGRVPTVTFADQLWYLRRLSAEAGGRFLIGAMADGTFAIPNGRTMEAMAVQFLEQRQETHALARRRVQEAVERSKRFIDAGADMILMCADYCFNDGPFLSPRMFAEFVTPYLHEVVRAIKAAGGYAVKHTDGNIMPILDQLLACEPSAIHSLDPQGGVDIAEVKALAAGRTCLMGGVHCGMMQTGSDADVVRSAKYCLYHGMPGGGYMFGLSNVAFKGLTLERYDLLHRVWREYGRYPMAGFSVDGEL